MSLHSGAECFKTCLSCGSQGRNHPNDPWEENGQWQMRSETEYLWILAVQGELATWQQLVHPEVEYGWILTASEQLIPEGSYLEDEHRCPNKVGTAVVHAPMEPSEPPFWQFVPCEKNGWDLIQCSAPLLWLQTKQKGGRAASDKFDDQCLYVAGAKARYKKEPTINMVKLLRNLVAEVNRSTPQLLETIAHQEGFMDMEALIARTETLMGGGPPGLCILAKDVGVVFDIFHLGNQEKQNFGNRGKLRIVLLYAHEHCVPWEVATNARSWGRLVKQWEDDPQRGTWRGGMGRGNSPTNPTHVFWMLHYLRTRQTLSASQRRGMSTVKCSGKWSTVLDLWLQLEWPWKTLEGQWQRSSKSTNWEYNSAVQVATSRHRFSTRTMLSRWSSS